MMQHCAHPHRGFSLIEAAVVLGIVGLVIGGIWIAAADLRSKVRVNETATDILKIASAARNLLPVSSYPEVVGTNIDVTVALRKAGVFPASFVSDSGGVLAPSGIRISVTQACFGPTTCPILGIRHRGATSSWKPGYMIAAECNQLVQRITSLTRDRSDLSHIQIENAGNSNYLLLYPPIDPDDVNCPETFSQLWVWFRP